MAATAADYAWWRTWRPGWAEAHCVTLMGGSTAEDVLGALPASVVTSVRGIDALHEIAVNDWPDGYDPARGVVGVTEIAGDWVLVAEINGFVGVTERLIGPMSPGRTIVSHFSNINEAHRFNWWRDGRLLVDFDPLFPEERFGAEPAALLDDIRAVGIPLDAEAEEIADIDVSAAGFALAQRITGVACTPELFERSDFRVAEVAIPGGAEQQRYGEALRATWCAPTTW